jgi:hypothetical protein
MADDRVAAIKGSLNDGLGIRATAPATSSLAQDGDQDRP